MQGEKAHACGEGERPMNGFAWIFQPTGQTLLHEVVFLLLRVHTHTYIAYSIHHLSQNPLQVLVLLDTNTMLSLSLCLCLQALYSLGLRKFLLAGVGPLGCIPNQLARGIAPPGRCVDSVNQMVGPFNVGLRSLVDQLNSNHPEAIFVYGNTYGALGDMLNTPAAYGKQQIAQTVYISIFFIICNS